MSTSMERPRGRQPIEPEIVDPQLESLAQLMDNAFGIPGSRIRFGLDSVVGLVPGVGDTLTSLVSLYILAAARKYGLSRIAMLRMASNVAVDYALGSIPIVGDVFDVYWKANVRNLAILKRHLIATPTELRRARRGDWLFVGALIVVLLLILVGSVVVTWWLVALMMRLIASV